MRKTLSAGVLILALLFLALVGGQHIKFGKTNPFPPVYNFTDPPVLSIHSPVNETYVNSVLLNFTVTKPEVWLGTSAINGHYQTYDGVTYIIDERYYTSPSTVDRNLSSPFNYFAYLTNLTDGPHNLTVHAYATGSVWDQYGLCDYHPQVESSSVVYFALDTTLPSVSILSLENKTYYTPDIPLNFTLNEVIAQITYSLDGQDNVTVAGNTTLTGLSEGAHNLTIFATDFARNVGASETLTFTVAAPEPFPTTLVIASVASAVVIGIGLLVYFKKRLKFERKR